MAFANGVAFAHKFDTPATSHDVPIPSVSVDHGLVMQVTTTAAVPTTPAGWTQLYNTTISGVTGAAYKKIATASEPATIAVPLGASAAMTAVVTVVANWDGTLAGIESVSKTQAVGAAYSTHDRLTVTWGVADNLYMAGVSAGNDGVVISNNEALTGFVAINSVLGVDASTATAAGFHEWPYDNWKPTRAFTYDSSENDVSTIFGFKPGTAGTGALPASVDTTPPTFDVAPNVTATSSAGHTVSSTLNEAGTIYGVRLTDAATAPSSAQVKAGQDSTGAAAPEADSVAATAATNADLVFSTGAASTAYDYYIVAEDDETTPNLQASPTLVGATTAATGPTLSTVPSTVYPNESIVLGVTNAGAVKGTGGVTIGGVAQTIDSWSDTSVTITGVLGVNSYGAGKTIELTTDSATTATGTIEFVADTAGAFGYVVMSSPDTTDSSSVATGATPTVVTGDQFEWEDFNALGSLVVDAQGFVSSVTTEGTFRGRFWDATDSTWGAVETFTAAAEDVTAPTVLSVNQPTSGSYKAGDTISWTVNFSESVTASGCSLTTTLGSVALTSGSGSSALVFTYTVQPGDGTVGVTATALTGGSIADAATNAANRTLNSVGGGSAVIVDTVNPVITITGSNPFEILQGNTYTDLGATASDSQDGSLGSVTGIGTVDTATLGQYTITYPGAGVVDTAGNVADDAIRYVNVVAEITSGLTDKKKQNRRRQFAAYCYGAWRGRF